MIGVEPICGAETRALNGVRAPPLSGVHRLSAGCERKGLRKQLQRSHDPLPLVGEGPLSAAAHASLYRNAPAMVATMASARPTATSVVVMFDG
jgi:hypothetical protein